MKQIFLSLLSIFSLGVIALAIAGWWGANQYLSAGPLGETKYVLIKQGSGVSQIAQKLYGEKVISNPLIFKAMARFSDTLKAGEYEFPAGITMKAAMEKLQEGEVYSRKFTIPEGLTSYQIVKILNAQEGLSGDISSIPAEGSLLPDTYLFSSNETRSDKIKQMQSGMTKALDELWESRADGLPIKTKKEALILASIVEKETGVGLERSKVAGVFINRLKINMPLQTDPTVIYALTMGKMKDDGKGPLGRRLLRKDLKVDSPYNTYKNRGLPPGPICNPGRAAIEATLNPQVHDYIYFVADGTGGHAFGRNLKEHNANVAKWRKIRKSQQ
jgi:UPF0755 protein